MCVCVWERERERERKRESRFPPTIGYVLTSNHFPAVPMEKIRTITHYYISRAIPFGTRKVCVCVCVCVCERERERETQSQFSRARRLDVLVSTSPSRSRQAQWLITTHHEQNPHDARAVLTRPTFLPWLLCLPPSPGLSPADSIIRSWLFLDQCFTVLFVLQTGYFS